MHPVRVGVDLLETSACVTYLFYLTRVIGRVDVGSGGGERVSYLSCVSLFHFLSLSSPPGC